MLLLTSHSGAVSLSLAILCPCTRFLSPSLIARRVLSFRDSPAAGATIASMPLMAQAVAEIPFVEIFDRPWPSGLWGVLLIAMSVAVVILLAIWLFVIGWKRRSARDNNSSDTSEDGGAEVPAPSSDEKLGHDQDKPSAAAEDAAPTISNRIFSLASSWNSFSLPVLPSPLSALRRSISMAGMCGLCQG